MKKIVLGAVMVLSALVLAGVAGASMIIPNSDKAKENSKAPENSPVISENWELERVDFIHYAKPDRPGKPDKPSKGGDSCSKLMGVKWKEAPVDYVINPANFEGLLESFVATTTFLSVETWDNETSLELVNDIYTLDYTAQYGVQNYENAIVFGSHVDDNVIAVTSVWYMRKGKKIVEFDMLFNEFFDWGDASINPAKMDFQNIAVHEFGHALGLSDVYSDSCSSVTMYGYSGEGDIEKRTLEQSDIGGLQRMYGI